MGEISVKTGKQIRIIRKQRGLTLDMLSNLIGRSKSVLSKYEKGEICVDIETLCALARALRVSPASLLYNPQPPDPEVAPVQPAFFNGLTRFYSYLYDGRNNHILRCVFDVLAPSGVNRHDLLMYMNFADYANYRQCENTYQGFIEHFDAVTNIELTNRDTPMERAGAQILASYLDSDCKWGLWQGFSSRPMMPIAAKMLFVKTPLKEDDKLATRLKISREDIRLLRLYNMLSVI